MKRAVFLDRDGVINQIVFRDGKPGSPRAVSEFHFKSQIFDFCNNLKKAGFELYVVTNQPDTGNGLCSEDELTRMHQLVTSKLPIKAIGCCMSHDDADPRRKPNPGMLLDFIKQDQIDVKASFMIGDTSRDVGAARNAGVTSILIETDYNRDAHGTADYNCSSFEEIEQILKGDFVARYLNHSRTILEKLDSAQIELTAQTIANTRANGGRLFIIGSGGGAGHASHAACDFRKICDIETYVPTDNVSELTARVNDQGWALCISEYLKVSRLNSKDCLLVFSVGGGSLDGAVSPNLVSAMRLAEEVDASICAIVGRDGGCAKELADACVVVPVVDKALITPHTEGFQALVWHLLVSHPVLQINQTKWESLDTKK